MNKKLSKYMARRMQERRKKVDFKLAYMAARVGMSIKQLQAYERAEVKISASILYQIAFVLGVNPDYFFKGFKEFEKHVDLLTQVHIRPDRLSTLNILLIEDGDGDVLITRKAFQSSSVPTEIIAMYKSEDVFKFLRNNIPGTTFFRPDVILLDLNLPEKDGISILREIKQDKYLSDIPVIILSGSFSKCLMIECYKEYASGYICKSFDFNEFARNIDIFARYWAQAVALPSRQLKKVEDY